MNWVPLVVTNPLRVSAAFTVNDDANGIITVLQPRTTLLIAAIHFFFILVPPHNNSKRALSLLMYKFQIPVDQITPLLDTIGTAKRILWGVKGVIQQSLDVGSGNVQPCV